METMDEFVNKHCYDLKLHNECLKNYTPGGWNSMILPTALNILEHQIRKTQINYLLIKNGIFKDDCEVK